MNEKLNNDQEENDEAGVRKPISLWHAVCIAGLVVLYFYLYKWK
jgi:hypothetical protein